MAVPLYSIDRIQPGVVECRIVDSLGIHAEIELLVRYQFFPCFIHVWVASVIQVV